MTQTIEHNEANQTDNEPTLAARQYARYDALLTKLINQRRAAREAHNAGDWRAYRRYVRLCRAICAVDETVNRWFDRRDWETEKAQREAVEGAYGPRRAA